MFFIRSSLGDGLVVRPVVLGAGEGVRAALLDGDVVEVEKVLADEGFEHGALVLGPRKVVTFCLGVVHERDEFADGLLGVLRGTWAGAAPVRVGDERACRFVI